MEFRIPRVSELYLGTGAGYRAVLCERGSFHRHPGSGLLLRLQPKVHSHKCHKTFHRAEFQYGDCETTLSSRGYEKKNAFYFPFFLTLTRILLRIIESDGMIIEIGFADLLLTLVFGGLVVWGMCRQFHVNRSRALYQPSHPTMPHLIRYSNERAPLLHQQRMTDGTRRRYYFYRETTY